MIERIEPILTVASVRVSADFYVRMLGFKIDHSSDSFAVVSCDTHYIYLSRGDPRGHQTMVWIGVEMDVEQLHTQLKANGAKILRPPTNYSWALQMEIEDPDGHILRIGAEPKTDQPFADA